MKTVAPLPLLSGLFTLPIKPTPENMVTRSGFVLSGKPGAGDFGEFPPPG